MALSVVCQAAYQHVPVVVPFSRFCSLRGTSCTAPAPSNHQSRSIRFNQPLLQQPSKGPPRTSFWNRKLYLENGPDSYLSSTPATKGSAEIPKVDGNPDSGNWHLKYSAVLSLHSKDSGSFCILHHPLPGLLSIFGPSYSPIHAGLSSHKIRPIASNVILVLPCIEHIFTSHILK